MISVAAQTYQNIEHIVVDGASTDDTLQIVHQFPHVARVISEKDSGMFNAMNKGIRVATGDIVGIINSDDFFTSNNVIEEIVNDFKSEYDAVIGDVAFVESTNLKKIVRYYSSKNWKPSLFKWGFMPPHPSFYLRRNKFELYGLYKEDYRISADYELMIRMLYSAKLNYHYLPMNMVIMRLGGISTKNIKARYILNREIVRACRENHINTNMGMLMLKYFIKIFEYIHF
jgi:glycosyltransferase involved in cell wall biosynthesis